MKTDHNDIWHAKQAEKRTEAERLMKNPYFILAAASMVTPSDKGYKEMSKKKWSTGEKIAVGGTAAALLLAAVGVGLYKIDSDKKNNKINELENKKTPMYDTVDGKVQFMNVLKHLNQTERSEIFSNLPQEVGAGSDVQLALDAILDDRYGNYELTSHTDRNWGLSIHMVPDGEGSFAYTVKNDTIEKGVVRQNISTATSYKLLHLIGDVAGEPLEYEGQGITPSKLMQINDLVEFDRNVRTALGNYTSLTLDAKNASQAGRVAEMIEKVPELAGIQYRMNMQGDVKNLTFIDLQDDAAGTPNGGGSIAVAYNESGMPVDVVVIGKNSTRNWVNDYYGKVSSTRSGTRSVELTYDEKRISTKGLNKHNKKAMKRGISHIEKEMKENGIAYLNSEKVRPGTLAIYGINKDTKEVAVYTVNHRGYGKKIL
ncbi:MAG: hypothetical protein PHU12_01640 [Candidatus Aenigmarchaeota archaeon]|nr:hypothetical protein [Candidatus Aenigmarchaeota archaeon]